MFGSQTIQTFDLLFEVTVFCAAKHLILMKFDCHWFIHSLDDIAYFVGHVKQGFDRLQH